MKKATVATLATGLPVLPGEQFWRVTYHSDGEVYGSGWVLEMHLPAPTRWRPERTIMLDRAYLAYRDDVPDAQVIREAAEQLLAERVVRKARNDLAGDYPPKRLD